MSTHISFAPFSLMSSYRLHFGRPYSKNPSCALRLSWTENVFILIFDFIFLAILWLRLVLKPLNLANHHVGLSMTRVYFAMTSVSGYLASVNPTTYEFVSYNSITIISLLIISVRIGP